jgi:hypothetical protein
MIPWSLRRQAIYHMCHCFPVQCCLPLEKSVEDDTFPRRRCVSRCQSFDSRKYWAGVVDLVWSKQRPIQPRKTRRRCEGEECTQYRRSTYLPMMKKCGRDSEQRAAVSHRYYPRCDPGPSDGKISQNRRRLRSMSPSTWTRCLKAFYSGRRGGRGPISWHSAHGGSCSHSLSRQRGFLLVTATWTLRAAGEGRGRDCTAQVTTMGVEDANSLRGDGGREMHTYIDVYRQKHHSAILHSALATIPDLAKVGFVVA